MERLALRCPYDALNRLRSVRLNGTLIARYGYDVLGRRIAKRVYSSSTGGTVAYTRFVYRGSHVAFETDSAGTMGLRYVWGLSTDDLVAIRDTVVGVGATTYYVVQDKLHSVRGLVRRDGTWIRSLSYFSYGALDDTASSGAPTWELRYRWTGRELDLETGLYFFRARYYDPGVRRFIQEDPIGYAGGGNVYAYGAGPLEGRDPSGMEMNADMMVCHNCRVLASHLDAPGDLFDWGWGQGGGDWMNQLALIDLEDDLAGTDYSAYLSNYKSNLLHFFANAGSAFQQHYLQDGRPLYENEFNDMKFLILDMLEGALSAGGRLPSDGLASIQRAEAFLLGGQVGYSESVVAWQTAEGGYVRGHATTGFAGGSGMTFIGDTYLRDNYFQQGVTLIHESLHYMYPAMGESPWIAQHAQVIARAVFYGP